MRFESPYPCCGPSTSSVLRTIKASVPCGTSVRRFIGARLLGFPKELWHASFGKARGMRHEGPCDMVSSMTARLLYLAVVALSIATPRAGQTPAASAELTAV